MNKQFVFVSIPKRCWRFDHPHRMTICTFHIQMNSILILEWFVKAYFFSFTLALCIQIERAGAAFSSCFFYIIEHTRPNTFVQELHIFFFIINKYEKSSMLYRAAIKQKFGEINGIEGYSNCADARLCSVNAES